MNISLPSSSQDRPADRPRHVAIIMDGNGRWAQRRALQRLKGHYEGAEALKRTVKAAREFGVEYLTVYAFSTENWSRPQDEVEGLLSLLKFQLKDSLPELIENNIRLKIIGSRNSLKPSILKMIESAEAATQECTGLTLVIAFNYGSRREIVEAMQQFAQDVKDGKRLPEDLTEALFSDYLYTKGIPDPDLLIRTSGVSRISNYLLWQLSYAEIIVTETFWPDFTRKDFEEALQNYQGRERRYGKISDQLRSA